MDVHCCTCREPWDQYFLRHELTEETPGDLAVEGWEFGRNRLVVLRCPACPKDGTTSPDAEARRAAVEEIAAVLGDDEDGLGATLEDFGL